MSISRSSLASACLMILTACSAPPDAAFDYPAASRSDHVDEYFGTRVADPYRWLEDLAAEETRAFVAAQNELAKPYLEAIPARERIRKRMQELWRYERASAPKKRGGRYFFETNDGTQEQDVLSVLGSLDGEPRTLIDPGTLSEDATVSLADWVPSPDGSRIAWAISDGGTDWKIWRVRDVESGQDLDDVIQHVKFTSVSWLPDSAGFYYSRYPVGDDGEADGSQRVAVYYHRVGGDAAQDPLVYATEAGSGHDPYPRVSDDGRYLILTIFEGYSTNGVYYQRLDEPDAPVVRLLDAWDAIYEFLGHRGDELFFRTTHQASGGRLVAIDPSRPEPEHWREVVPESENALSQAHLIGGRVLTLDLVDARSRLRLFELDGEPAGEVELPGLGTVSGIAGKPTDPETFFEFESFTSPPAVWRLDVATGETHIFRQSAFDSEVAGYETHQVFYESKDGTRVPMFLVHRPGLARDGEAPTLLYGYGGFNVSETPEYLVRWTTWLEMGGLLAVANLRGGSEYGEAWHQAGIKTRKQNVFDDFIAAAEWLIDEGYTRTPKLAIHGRSNGGLLVAAVTLERPELFGVSLPAVGVLDMLRYHTASANAYQWGSDYGWSENEDEFQALHAYSPVHNARHETCYPATLVTTADRDDRVVPWHSYKYAATLQHAQGCDAPVLLRIETRAGHGASKPTWMRIDDYADQWAFAAQVLGMEISL